MEDTRAAQWAAVDRHFKPGAFLAVIEPYFKRMADGTHGVRVDSPESDVVWLDSLGPPDAAGWQEQGKEHFRLLPSLHDISPHFGVVANFV